MKSNHRAARTIIQLLIALLALGLVACGDTGPQGEQGPEGPQGDEGPQGPPGDAGVVDNGTSVEACIGCHAAGTVVPVGDITDTLDAHYIDTDSDGPATASGLRQLDVTITEVDVTGSNVVIEFDVEDEDGDPVDVLFAADGRFTIAKLLPGEEAGDPTFWQSLINRTENPGVGPGTTPQQQATAENFTAGAGDFENLGGGSYRYTSAFNPSTGTYPVADGETMRVAIQISASDIPAGNGWCDFDADLSDPNDCTSAVSLTRDIVQTGVCNTCHGPTSDTKLALHGGGRTDVEYCVTCHNPGSTDANSGNTVDMTQMIHKIHAGSTLANGYSIYGFGGTLHDYSEVNFTKELGNCVVCHSGGGADEQSWNTEPSRQACGSCHDDVNFDTGENHATGVVAPGNEFCGNCHDPDGTPAAVQVVHLGPARAAEAAEYEYVIENTTEWDGASDDLTIDFSVTYGGAPMDLDNDPEWTAAGGASRLALIVGWSTSDYTNEESGSTPAQPISVNALDVGGVVTDNLDGTYTTVVDVSDASGTLTVALEGHPAADLDGNGTYSDRIAVLNAFVSLAPTGGRAVALARNDVIDIAKCNGCHDAAGQGVSLHGNNRTGEMQVCVLCHNSDATDVNRRPADPGTTLDGKAEETIDMKRMLHQIHAGEELENGIVIYGFGNSPNDFSGVAFTGNIANCETCHLAGTYSTEAARARLATSIDTGTDKADPSDDLNITQTASVCSSCHDSAVSKDHMVLHGASFHALDENID